MGIHARHTKPSDSRNNGGSFDPSSGRRLQPSSNLHISSGMIGATRSESGDGLPTKLFTDIRLQRHCFDVASTSDTGDPEYSAKIFRLNF